MSISATSLSGALALLTVGLALIGISLYAIIEALKRPSAKWSSADESKVGWCIALLISTFVQPIGVITATVFLVRIRRRLDGEVEQLPVPRI